MLYLGVFGFLYEASSEKQEALKQPRGGILNMQMCARVLNKATAQRLQAELRNPA